MAKNKLLATEPAGDAALLNGQPVKEKHESIWKDVFAGIVSNHVLPNVLPSIIVRATLGISTAILDAAALGFLGLGVQPPAAEWGDMLGRGRNELFRAPWLMIFPGLAITLTVLAFNLLGDGVRDGLDPKARKR